MSLQSSRHRQWSCVHALLDLGFWLASVLYLKSVLCPVLFAGQVPVLCSFLHCC
jgi:hypothetical protein